MNYTTTAHTLADNASWFTPRAIAEQKDIDCDVPSNEPLTAAAENIITALKRTGPWTFDDSQQFSLYQNLLTALLFIDEYADTSLCISDYKTGEDETANYHPLGEIHTLEDPSIRSLAKRYNTGEIQDKINSHSETDTRLVDQDGPTDADSIHFAITECLCNALVVLADGPIRDMIMGADQDVVRALVCINEQFGQTELTGEQHEESLKDLVEEEFNFEPETDETVEFISLNIRKY